MAKTQQITLTADKESIKILKTLGVDWDTKQGQTFDAVFQSFKAVQDIAPKYPEEVRNSIEGLIENAINKAKQSGKLSGWVGDGGANDRGSLFSNEG